MYGPGILVRSLSVASVRTKAGVVWQYHSQSDRHSKVACWGIIFDLMLNCPHLRQHVAAGKVGFGINHTMTNFEANKKKNLDLVLCTPAGLPGNKAVTLGSLATLYNIQLDSTEAKLLAQLPILTRVPVGNVLMALEAKAAMTEHQKALPRLYDELNSSFQTINGASGEAIASAYVLVNAGTTFISPSRQHPNNPSPVVTTHAQPKAASLVINTVHQLPRRSASYKPGYDAIGITLIDMANDGSPVTLVSNPPAPQSNDIYYYDMMIGRLAHTYSTRFKHL